MKAEALLDALAHTLEEITPGKFGDTLDDVEGIAHTISSCRRTHLFTHWVMCRPSHWSTRWLRK